MSSSLKYEAEGWNSNQQPRFCWTDEQQSVARVALDQLGTTVEEEEEASPVFFSQPSANRRGEVLPGTGDQDLKTLWKLLEELTR